MDKGDENTELLGVGEGLGAEANADNEDEHEFDDTLACIDARDEELDGTDLERAFEEAAVGAGDADGVVGRISKTTDDRKT